MSQMSLSELAAKINWEGGVVAALEYGITPEEIKDPEMAVLWNELFELYDQMRPRIHLVEGICRQARRSDGSPDKGE